MCGMRVWGVHGGQSFSLGDPWSDRHLRLPCRVLASAFAISPAASVSATCSAAFAICSATCSAASVSATCCCLAACRVGWGGDCWRGLGFCVGSMRCEVTMSAIASLLPRHSALVTAADNATRHRTALLQPNQCCSRALTSNPAHCGVPPRDAK